MKLKEKGDTGNRVVIVGRRKRQVEEKGEGRDRVVGIGRGEELVKRINRNYLCICRQEGRKRK
jgi:hypothetical protein